MAQNCNTTTEQTVRQGGVAFEQPVLLGIKAVAKLLDCSVRHVHRLRDGGRMPQPVKLGSLVKWNRAELDQWVASGCPSCRRSGR
jgi:excisionase family DNA binding protein